MAVAIIPALAGLVEAGIGASSASKQQERSDALFGQRQAYKTPSQVLDIYNMAENNAQTGYDPTTLSYLTSQTQGALAGGLSTATKLGADPNDLSAMLDKNFQQIFSIGSNNNLVKMQKFDSLVNATQLVAQNKDAEFVSRDNLLKDQLQNAGQRTQVDRADEQGGINLALNGFSALQKYYQSKKPTPAAVSDNSPYINPATVDAINYSYPTATVVAPS